MRTDSVGPMAPVQADEPDTNNQGGGGAKDPSTRKSPLVVPRAADEQDTNNQSGVGTKDITSRTSLPVVPPPK